MTSRKSALPETSALDKGVEPVIVIGLGIAVSFAAFTLLDV